MSDWTPDIARLQAFDDQEWLRVERAFCGRLMAYVSRRVPDDQAREDILQETFLGAVRGIAQFDPIFTFEQYLFGICKNRTIDHMRRQKVATLGGNTEDDEPPLIEVLARESETPSRIVRNKDLARAGRDLLQGILRDWVQETWQSGEFVRLMVIEALFRGQWRNRDTWKRFDLRDETSVAGIKFRALRRLRELAIARDPDGRVLPLLAHAMQDDEELSVDVAEAWCSGRVSCPARHWLARRLAGTLDAGPSDFLAFHLNEMGCEWCQANHDDLVRDEQAASLEPLLDKVGASTLQYLRSRTIPNSGDARHGA